MTAPDPLLAAGPPERPPGALPALRRLRVTLLGTGTSTGVPIVGCGCRVCTSADPRDRRSRCAAYVVAETEAGPVHLVVDTGPDFRAQALRTGLDAVDAVLYTHHHFDHVAGADDLRPFLFRSRAPGGRLVPIPCYARPSTAAELRGLLGYIFADGSYPGVARLELRGVTGPFRAASRFAPGAAVAVTPIDVRHGALALYGYRVGRLAYLTDVSAIPEASFALLRDLDVLVLDALRPTPHPTHLTIADAVAVARRIGARRTYFIHMTHDVLHAETEAALPEGVHLGYDGLTLDVAL